MADYWLTPPIEKVYEALTAIADKRIELSTDQRSAKIYSSSGNKFYTVTYDPTVEAIMSNDNAAFYVGQLSYPMFAFLMMIGEVKYDPSLLQPLSGIKWKDINKKHKNNYVAAVEEVLGQLQTQGISIDAVKTGIHDIYAQVKQIKLGKLGPQVRPSREY